MAKIKGELRRQGKLQQEGYNLLLFLALGYMSFHSRAPQPCSRPRWSCYLCPAGLRVCVSVGLQPDRSLGSPAEKSQSYLYSSQKEEAKSKSEVSHGETKGHRLKLVVVNLEATRSWRVKRLEVEGPQWVLSTHESTHSSSNQLKLNTSGWENLPNMYRFWSLQPKQCYNNDLCSIYTLQIL